MDEAKLSSWDEEVPEQEWGRGGGCPTSFELAPGEQPVVSNVTYSSGKDWGQSGDVGEELPRYEEGRTGLVRPLRAVASYDESGSDDERPVYGEYVAPGREQHTVMKVGGRRVRTTKVLGIQVVKTTVEATDSQEWRYN